MGAFSIEASLTAAQKASPDVQHRASRLGRLLAQYGMEMRDDSRLAHTYLLSGGDAYLVAHELLCVNFLFERTRYGQTCEVGLRQLANAMREQYGLPWPRTWQLVREYGVPALKLYCLAESGLTMPDFFLCPLEEDAPLAYTGAEAGAEAGVPAAAEERDEAEGEAGPSECDTAFASHGLAEGQTAAA